MSKLDETMFDAQKLIGETAMDYLGDNPEPKTHFATSVACSVTMAMLVDATIPDEVEGRERMEKLLERCTDLLVIAIERVTDAEISIEVVGGEAAEQVVETLKASTEVAH